MKKKEAAQRMYELQQAIKALQDEQAEIREELAGKMKPGEAIEGDGYTVKLCPTKEIILHDNDLVYRLIGRETFIEVAKIGVQALRKAVSEKMFQAAVKAETEKLVLKVVGR